MNYSEAMDFLEKTKKYGSQLGLTSIQNLMNELGNVQDQIPVVHIGGTNGKGSVGAMLSSVFVTAGYKTGRFATPDVFSYEEEFMMDGTPIAKGRLAQLFTEVSEACKKLTDRGCPHPTRFEVETAAAFLWFSEEKCDVALIEVGMGGATDATNMIKKPILSILTSISMDHTRFLGDTLSRIAEVKSGIIKKECPVVTVRQQSEAMAVIEKRCAEVNAPLVCADVIEAEQVSELDGDISFSWKFGENPGDRWENIRLGLHGRFQVENALCALEALKILKREYPRLTENNIRDGLLKTYWPGRFERIGGNPDFYLDGAHNEDAVKKLRKTLDSTFTDRKIVYIMGVLADKDFQNMIETMFRPGDLVYTVTPDNPRALPGEELAEQLRQKQITAFFCENGKDAVDCALREAKQTDVILAFGSLSYLKEIRQAYETEMGKREKE